MRKRKLPRAGVTPEKRRTSGASQQTAADTTPSERSSAGSPEGLGDKGQLIRDDETEEDTAYDVVGVVRQKLLFKERPKPLVSRHLVQRGL
ncbi:hypothetical protein NSK_006516 [Nannochloropsis salina CCMP1776]|uniref:Uncharacterized protein n=1 Tax=Nannochloropsis salina CCMP1776 TaxID=1027361 RepID=A0A4D9CVS1_9STRA|nr:hypothetical protein NSK_006516 [Nannochloropsis salina CCMP1776]|eukprot:TFJ82187.1 hypothetical protein NSK_006516 [Nannochloropsis salina CCMP1776]